MKLTVQAWLLVALGVVSVLSFPLTEWEAWKAKYDKSYATPQEEKQRKEVWLSHYNVYQEHMANPDRQFEMELNEFSDQILPRNTVNRQSMFGKTDVHFHDVDILSFAPPDSWDWRKKGAVTPVKNQGQLGDALAFAATDCVESFNMIKTGSLASLSIGETHDCCTSPPLLSRDVFTCVHEIGGLCSRAAYPAPANICRNKTCTAQVQINGGMQSPSGDEEALMESVYKTPVLVGIDASHASFQMYTGGVYSEPSCSADKIDHALQLVGYGAMDGNDFWICKNSWGASWGMSGYILIARNKNNMCGIATDAFYPV